MCAADFRIVANEAGEGNRVLHGIDMAEIRQAVLSMGLQRFWARGYFSTTSGNITVDVILNYLDKHTAPTKPGFSPRP